MRPEFAVSLERYGPTFMCTKFALLPTGLAAVLKFHTSSARSSVSILLFTPLG